jgi:two-component system alkaline phosphatase synthesis response regulator PhoP
MVMAHQERILLIEDNPGFQFCYRNALEDDGYTVLEALDGEQGWEMARTQMPDLILLDLMLPKLHGFEVLKKIRDNPLTKSIPVVILSVIESPKDREKGLMLGANQYLVKSSESPKNIVKLALGVLARV